MRILAVARLTVTHAIRMRLMVVVILFVILLSAGLPFLLQTDGTLKGQVRITVSYAITAISFLLTIMTVLLATYILATEKKTRQLFLVDTKPIARWEILAGRWLGIVAANAAILLVVGVIITFLVQYITRRGTPDEIAEVEKQVLSARVALRPERVDVAALVAENFQRLREKDLIPPTMTEAQARAKLAENAERLSRTVPLLFERQWDLEGFPTDLAPDDELTVRFSTQAASGGRKKERTARWTVGQPGTPNAFYWWTSTTGKSAHEFQVPARCIEHDGTLTLRFLNAGGEYASTVIFDEKDGLEVLYPAGSFAPNLARALLMVLFRLAFLAAVGLLAASFLGFEVSLFACAAFLVMAIAAGFVSDLTGRWAAPPPGPPDEVGTPNIAMEAIAHGVRRAIEFSPFPYLQAIAPAETIANGRLVRLVRGETGMVLTWGVLLTLLAGAVFRRVELGTVPT